MSPKRWTAQSIGWALVGLFCAASAYAGGSSLNTVVVVNAQSSNSLDLANYYCERRQIPTENVLRISWTGGNTYWTSNDFRTLLLTPLLEMLQSRGLRQQVEYVVLSMDIPFQTRCGQSLNSTTSSLFYGLKDTGGPDARGVTNSYFGKEAIFGREPPASNPGHAFLATMITGNSLNEAKSVVDQGVSGDSSFPSAPVILAKSSDTLRNGRYHKFDNALFNAKFFRDMSMLRTNSDSPQAITGLLGYQTGLANFSIRPGTFVPGAIADSMTSFGGIIFGPNGQTTLLTFTGAGAAGSYGTVTEPSPVVEKFPDPRVYNYHSRGFSLAESYYQSVYDPHEGLIVGEPLSAPFARRGFGRLMAETNTTRGLAELSYFFAASDASLPISDVDLFIDGKLHTNVVRVPPAAGNRLKVSLNGYPIQVGVAPGQSIAQVASALAQEINLPQHVAATKVKALVFGDRLELRSLAAHPRELSFFLPIATPRGAGQMFYQAAPLAGVATPALSVLGRHSSGAFRLQLKTAEQVRSVIEVSENLATWAPAGTNDSGGLWEFIDSDAAVSSNRFYRVRTEEISLRPRLSLDRQTGRPPGADFTNVAYEIQVSSNLVNWATLHYNPQAQAWKSATLLQELTSRVFTGLAFRCRLWNPVPLQVERYSPEEGLLLRVDGATKPFVVYGSFDFVTWLPVYTNMWAGAIHTEAASEAGATPVLSTHLTASRPCFLDSIACGRLACSVNGSLQPGSWLGVAATKTNGERVVICATNEVAGGTFNNLCGGLIDAINAHPDLQDPAGMLAEDLAPGLFGGVSFNLVARSPGRGPAELRVQLLSSPGMMPKPAGQVPLLDNISDLQPRNHLFVRSGTVLLPGKILFDSTQLSDGVHEFTVVAYEGSHVRTQTRASLLVNVQNTGLAANFVLSDRGATAPITSRYDASVTVNTTEMATVSLYGTAGRVATRSVQGSAVFSLAPDFFGAGLHPFYAVIETASGARYRTETQRIRFSR